MKNLKVLIYLIILSLTACNISNDSTKNAINIQLNMTRDIIEIKSIDLTIKASDMDTITGSTTDTEDATIKESNTINVDVPIGKDRTFSIVVTLEDDTTLSGSVTQDVKASTTTVPIDISYDDVDETVDETVEEVISTNPIAPENLTLSISSNQVVLTWDIKDDDLADKFNIYKDDEIIDTVDSDIDTWTDATSTDIIEDTILTYKVSSSNGDGDSMDLNDDFTTATINYYIPKNNDDYLGLSAEYKSETVATLNWDSFEDASNADHYEIWYGTTAADTLFKKITDLSITSEDIPSLTLNTSYFIEIRVVSENGIYISKALEYLFAITSGISVDFTEVDDYTITITSDGSTEIVTYSNLDTLVKVEIAETNYTTISYEWYIDGEVDGSSAIPYELNISGYSVGTHELVVFVTIDDVLYSKSTYFDVYNTPIGQ